MITGRGFQELPIANIIEVKKDDFEQGRAQLYMQLYSAFKKNIKFDQEANFPLYGAITNCLQWIFVQYDGETLLKHHHNQLQIQLIRDGFNRVFNFLTVMFQTQLEVCKPFVVCCLMSN